MKFLFALFLVQMCSFAAVDTFAEQVESLKGVESPVASGPSAEELRQMDSDRQEKERKRQARIQKRMHKIQSLEKEMVRIDGIILNFTNRMEDMEADIDKLHKEETKARLKLHDKLELFNVTARQIARLERLPLEAMAAATSLRAGYDRKSVVESGRKSLSGLILKNRDDIYEIQEIRVQRQSKKNEIDSLRHDLLSEREKLQSFFKKQINLLALDDSEKARLTARALRMKQEKNIAVLLEKYAKSDNYLPPVRHSLKKLPVKGQLIKSYNEKISTGFYTKGITIETTAKEPVISLKDGRVIYSDIFRDYGYMVIVEHADGSHTLYSGLDKSGRDIGYFAPAGSVIGYMPKNAKPELYLEVRKNGKTLDPVMHLSLNKTS
jgi:septal ring factor EnvC (AmiA/AmiB activator)